VPRPDHIVVVILENKHRSSVTTQAPYLNKLAAKGANMTHSYGATHPSQPNIWRCSPGPPME
jgi:phosphatidylinositol-3-phosphatase